MENTEWGCKVASVEKTLTLSIMMTITFTMLAGILLDGFIEHGNLEALVFGIILLSVAIGMLIIPFTSKLTLFEKAVVSKTLFGTKVITLDKDVKIYIKAVTMSGAVPYLKVTLINADRKIKVSSYFKNLTDFVDALQEFQKNELLPSAIWRFNTSQSIDFGRIKLKNTGVMFNQKTYLWDEVEDIVLMEVVTGNYNTKMRKLFVNAKPVMAVKDIANFEVFTVILSMALEIKNG